MPRTRLYLKDGVSLNGLTVEGIRIIAAGLRTWGLHGWPRLTVTSGTDGVHSASNSGHTIDFDGDEYYGFALDFRTKDLVGGSMGDDAKLAVKTLQVLLGPAYDVVLEADHIHIEFDRRAFPGGKP